MDIIIITQHLLLLSVFSLSGLTDGSDVTQAPMLWKYRGDNASIDCSHTKGAGYYQMYWYRQLPGETMKLIVFTIENTKPAFEADFSEERFSAAKPDAHSGTLTVKGLVPRDKGWYFCAVRENYEAYFGPGTKLTVLEPGREVKPPEVKILRPSSNECRNKKDKKRKKTLVCVASDFYPDHVSVSWKINEASVTEGVATDNAALRAGDSYRITSRLRVSAAVWEKPDNTFTCTVSFFNGAATSEHPETINGVEGQRNASMTRAEYLVISQNAKLSYSVFIVKSCVYGAFVGFLVWKLQSSSGKQNN